ncbi:hypothetical protein GCM10017566_54080 [Amycolatopsis bartoniae]|uniref:Uncharacterized protein n=1 Tax=Amycolatopsis bartoniae TaxID=941986 RepID=A0A8H9MFP7_9PSEU|nr:hypothetical protein GCM10017566_54080 [Amycolatopsis bartoniae]
MVDPKRNKGTRRGKHGPVASLIQRAAQGDIRLDITTGSMSQDQNFHRNHPTTRDPDTTDQRMGNDHLAVESESETFEE